ncbi:uncharacterized protein LOC144667402 [Oculina patagonica]
MAVGVNICRLWRSTLIISVFHRSTGRISLVPLLTLSSLLKFQKRVLSLSSFSEKSFSTTQKYDVTQRVTAKEEEEIKRKHISEISVNRKIHIGNLRRGRDFTTEDTLFEYFSKYGEIQELEFFRNKLTHLSRGFAFVTFCNVESARKVLAESHIIDGQNVTIAVPVKKQKNAAVQKRDMTVLVSNIMKNTNKEVVARHFSKFGRVDRVILAQKGQADDEDLSSYYVIFSCLLGAQKALEEPTQKIADQNIDSQVMALPETTPVTKEYVGRTNHLALTSVPDSLTVEDLRDYFQQYGDVQYIDFIVHGSKVPYSQKDSNTAFIRFSDDAVVEEIVTHKNHLIVGSEVKVSKYKSLRTLPPEEMRELKVSVEGLPLSTRQQEVKRYFEKTFGILLNGVFFKEQHVFDKKLICIVRFFNQADLERVLKETQVSFHGSPLYFRRLGWKKQI